MRNFFDLNKRTQKAWGSIHVNALDTEEVLPRLTAVRQAVMYIGVFTGVIFSTAVNHLRSGAPEFTVTCTEAVLAAIIALVIIPVVYEKLKLHPGTPFIVQFGIFVQNGVFWHILIDSVGRIL
jgi:hypothetical protein